MELTICGPDESPAKKQANRGNCGQNFAFPGEAPLSLVATLYRCMTVEVRADVKHGLRQVDREDQPHDVRTGLRPVYPVVAVPLATSCLWKTVSGAWDRVLYLCSRSSRFTSCSWVAVCGAIQILRRHR